MSTSPPSQPGSFSSKRAADIVGISYRQLDYWARTDLIRPSLTDAKGSGTRRHYSYTNLIELKLVKTLLDNGNRLEAIRDAFTYLREQLGESDIASAKLVITGNSAVLVRENEELIDIVNRYQGQGVLNLLPLDGVKEQVDAAIVELFPDQAPAGEAEPAAPEAEDEEPPAAFRPTASGPG